MAVTSASFRPRGLALLGVDLRTLARWLGTWAMRDDTKAQPEVREAANAAMETVDRMLAELHAIRGALITEMRESDDATGARVDALLKTRSDKEND